MEYVTMPKKTVKVVVRQFGRQGNHDNFPGSGCKNVYLDVVSDVKLGPKWGFLPLLLLHCTVLSIDL